MKLKVKRVANLGTNPPIDYKKRGKSSPSYYEKPESFESDRDVKDMEKGVLKEYEERLKAKRQEIIKDKSIPKNKRKEKLKEYHEKESKKIKDKMRPEYEKLRLKRKKMRYA
jgi:hypothetical protein